MLMKNFCFKRESSGLNLFCSDQSETFLYLFVFPLYLRYARDMRKAYMLYRQILHNGVANVDVKVYSSALNDLSELYESKGCFSFCTDSLFLLMYFSMKVNGLLITFHPNSFPYSSKCINRIICNSTTGFILPSFPFPHHNLKSNEKLNFPR